MNAITEPVYLTHDLPMVELVCTDGKTAIERLVTSPAEAQVLMAAEFSPWRWRTVASLVPGPGEMYPLGRW